MTELVKNAELTQLLSQLNSSADEVSFEQVMQVISDNYRYKLGVGKVEKTGESPYKNSFGQMSFGRRDLVGESDGADANT